MAFTDAFFGAGIGQIQYDVFGCTGLESRLTDCSFDPVMSNCPGDHTQDAGVRCNQGVCSKLFSKIVEECRSVFVCHVTLCTIILRIFCTQVVRKARLDWQVAADPVKVVLRSALVVPGAQSVMTSGTMLRLLLFAGSLDYQLMVRL